MHHVILDAPDPTALAEFYSALLGLPITYTDDDFAVVSVSTTTSGIAFQRSNAVPPSWPDDGPLLIHMDVMVDAVDVAVDDVIRLGARVLRRDDGCCVLADPAGHPFCLIPRPHWAPPVNAT